MHRLVLAIFVLASALTAPAQRVSLREWQFLPDPSGSIAVADLSSASGWRAARAGLSWNAQFDDLRDYMGAAWYRTTIQIPRFDPPRRVLLRFAAVDYRCEVFVNGKRAGEHEGGYTPFVLDLTDRVHPGDNAVAVRVFDPPKQGEAEGLRYAEIPHGKQSWYVQTSGLWQPVTLEFRPASYIERVRVTPEISGRLQIEVDLAGAPAASGELKVVVRDPQGAAVLTRSIPLDGKSAYEMSGDVGSPELWSPEHPALYAVEVELGDDSVHSRFGFRRFEARDGKLYLNGRPFYMRAALDQDFYPDTIYSPPSAAYVRREMQAAHDLGLNLLRCHIKVCEPEYLDAADEAGILVWYEIPNWDHFSKASAQRGEETLEAMVARDWNHPSIVIQSIINESWGIDLKKPDERQWLARMYERAHELTAPLGRLIVDNSACCQNFHLRTDLADFHQYFSIPDHAGEWDAWVRDFAARPAWIFSPFGDAQSTGSEPLIVSEFGNWGLPQLPEQLPWWFRRDASAAEITHPEGVRERFHQFKFDRIFSDYNALALATQRHQFLALKHEIETIRRRAAIQGYVITEFTDLNWESNGLLTMWREPKSYAADLRRIQQPDVVLAEFSKHNFTAGETATASVEISHFGTRALRGDRVYWWTDTGQGGSLPILDEPAPSSNVAVGVIRLPAEIAHGRALATEHVYLELRDASGEPLAENQYALNVFAPSVPAHAQIIFYDPGDMLPRLRGQLLAHGYMLNDHAPLMIATRWDDRVAAFVRQGGRAVLLAQDPLALPSGFPVQLKERKDDYDGNWISNFAWVLPQSPVFSGLTVEPILGWEAAAVTPRAVLSGVKPGDFDDVLAGMFYGWLNLNSPLLVQARFGKGRAMVTTFAFDRYGEDPYATALLDAIARYAASPACQPRLEWQ